MDLKVCCIYFVVFVMKFRETDLEVCSGKKFREMQMHVTSVNRVDKHPVLNTG